MAEALKALRRGEKIWIYLEGGLPGKGKIRKGRNGVAFLHQQTGAPIAPVGIIGNGYLLNRRIPFLPSLMSLLRLNRVKVVIGKPIYSLGNLNLEEGASVVMDEITQLIKFSCLAEVLTLAAYKKQGNYTVGWLDLKLVEEISELGSRLGLKLAPFQNRCGYITEDYLQRIKDVRTGQKIYT